MKKVLLVSVITLLLFSIFFLATSRYGVIEVANYGGSQLFEQAKQQPFDSKKVFPSEISFAIIKTGEAGSQQAFAYSGGSWSESYVASHAAILVRHPQGTFLFDTGLGEKIDQQFEEEMPFWLKTMMKYEKQGSVRSQLEANGIDPTEIQKVILSHLHWDHASGLEDFLHAEVLTPQEEYDYAKEFATSDPAYMNSQYDNDQIRWNLIQFRDGSYENFPQSFDLFQDGSVVLVPMPGHSLGSIGMFLNLPSQKRFLFTGDTTWMLEGFQIPADKFWLSSLVVDHDKEGTRESIVRVHQLMKQYPDLIVVPAHDEIVHQKLGNFPQWIR